MIDKVYLEIDFETLKKLNNRKKPSLKMNLSIKN